MQDKEALVRVYVFFPLPLFYGVEYKLGQVIAHLSVTKASVGKAF